MIVEDFNELKTNTLVYGGKSGQKLGVIINGDNWFLKFPKSTKRFSKQVDMSYSTSPLSSLTRTWALLPALSKRRLIIISGNRAHTIETLEAFFLQRSNKISQRILSSEHF